MTDLSRLTPCYLFRGDDLNVLNHDIWETIALHGRHLSFAGPGEKVKQARHIHATVQLYGKAISDLAAGIVPTAWLYRGKAVQEYMKSFDDPDNLRGFEYTYAQRLQKYRIPNPNYPQTWWQRVKDTFTFQPRQPITYDVNQLCTMRKQLEWSIENGVSNQRIVAITYRPGEDNLKGDIPCLQVAKASLLQDNEVSLEFAYRSHDYGHGVWANACYLLYGFNKYVVEPAGGVVKEFIFDSLSAQLYTTDMDMVYDEIGWPERPSCQQNSQCAEVI